MKRYALFLLLGLTALPYACKETASVTKFDQAFTPYISAFTSGIISSEEAIRIRLTSNLASEEMVGSEVEEDVFSFSPSITGNTIWEDPRTLKFTPEKPLKSGQVYEGSFYLGRILQVADSLDRFRFQFKVIEQNVEIEVTELLTEDPENPERMMVRGVVYTADVAEEKAVQEAVSGRYIGSPVSLSWEHESSRKVHRFTVMDLKRQSKSQPLVIEWEGRPLGIRGDGKTEVEVPGLDEFKVTRVNVQNEPDQQITVEFSDPLDESQDLTGLIRLGENDNIRLVRNINQVVVLTTGQLSGNHNLVIDKGVRNRKGITLDKAVLNQVTFEEMKPAVRLVGKGVILPKSEGLVFPFEAVNLNAVDITIIKVFESNVLQFLQVNNLEEQNELARVGRIVKQTSVPLNPSNPMALQQWSRYGIKLDELIQTEPGAIYHVGLSFKKSYSLHECAGGTDEANEETQEEGMEYMQAEWDGPPEERSYWDYYGSWYNYNYDWAHRDNPCHIAYYRRDRFVGRNVLASDLGILAKLGDDGSFTCTVADLATTKPKSGVKVTVYNYQQQPLAQLTTNNSGMASVKLIKKPFALVAESGDQKGYLKLNDGQSLSVSRFDVSGVDAKSGIKGFLYGDRGVWRPGDSVYLTLILEDKLNKLPMNYPVQLELRDARGQIAQKFTKTPAEDLTYDFRFATQPDDPTGNWIATAHAGGAEFTKTLRIETVKPNRLKVQVKFDKEPLMAKDAPHQATIESRWLHGATAGELKYDVEAQLIPANTTFKGYPNFVFDDPASDFYTESQVIAEGTLDAEGKARFTANFEVNELAPGMLQGNFRARVYERGGDFSTDRFSMAYHPHDVYVGMFAPKGDQARGMLLTDTNHVVNLVTVDAEGKPVANRELEVSLYKLNYSWWWNQDDNDDLSSFFSRNSATAIQTETVFTDGSGKANWKLRVNYPSWGRYLVRVRDVEGDHITGTAVFIDWPGWAGRGQREQTEGATMLTFTADKEVYNVGETVQLTIPSSEGGRAWISLENGKTILRSFWVDTDKEQTTVTFETDKGMTPTVYAHVSLIQPHAQTANDVPIRMYGIVPLRVEDPSTHLKPMITTADEWRPESQAKITVQESSGKPMTYTVAVVDEGLLDLTRFKTPDPWAHFYAKEALGVKTWDVYDEVLGAMGTTMEQLLSIGGGAEINQPSGSRANRFIPMVRFLGPFELEKNDKANHTINIPQYVGSVRVMVVASGENYDYGNAEKAVPVRTPLMVLTTLPRVLGPEEIVQVPVSVFAMKDHVKEVTVSLKTNEMLEVKGSASKTIRFTEPGEQLVTFEVAVKPTVGIARVEVQATSGNERAQQKVELQVRNPNPVEHRQVSLAINPGTSGEVTFSAFGIPGTNSATLELTTVPPLNLARRLDYLIRYPHGCVEQTVSSVFPQLYVQELMELPPDKQEAIDNNIKVGIQKMKRFQQANGGLSYWPGLQAIDDWSTVYAGHFMLEAEQKGYTLPYGFKDKWIDHQQKLARQWSATQSGSNYGRSSMLIQAYRLYALALAGKPEMGAMNRMGALDNLNPQAAWRLSAAYALAGQKDRALALTRGVGWVFPAYKESYYTYGSHIRDKAMVLETLVILGQTQNARELAEELASFVSNDKWYSTQTTAYALIALSKYALNQGGKGLQATVQWPAGNVQVSTQRPISQLPVDAEGAQNQSIHIENNNERPLYVQLVVYGKPSLGAEKAASKNLAIEVEYYSADGDRISPSVIGQGMDVVVDVTVRNPGGNGNYRNLALTQVFPSGWEITNTRLDQFETDRAKVDEPTYTDIRDDRVMAYFDLNASQEKTFRFLVHASYLGRFYLPSVRVEAMYDDEIYAGTKGQWVNVVMPGKEVGMAP